MGHETLDQSAASSATRRVRPISSMHLILRPSLQLFTCHRTASAADAFPLLLVRLFHCIFHLLQAINTAITTPMCRAIERGRKNRPLPCLLYLPVIECQEPVHKYQQLLGITQIGRVTSHLYYLDMTCPQLPCYTTPRTRMGVVTVSIVAGIVLDSRSLRKRLLDSSFPA